MNVELNHTIVWTRDKAASAEFLAGILGVCVGAPSGPFVPVRLANRVTLDFADAHDVRGQHLAFLVSDSDFDAAFARLRAAGIAYWADPMHQEQGQINHWLGGRGVYFEDPDGHNMELLTRAESLGPVRATGAFPDRELKEPGNRCPRGGRHHRDHALAVRYLSGRPFGEIPIALLAAAKVLAPVDRGVARRTLLDAVELAIVTGHFISGVTGAEVGRAALALRADGGSNPGIDDLLLAGLATLAADGYVKAAPLLRRAVTAMAAPDAVGAAVPPWFIDGVYATHALWDDQARHDWLQRCERVARATGALHHLQQALTCLSTVEAQTGQLSSAEARGEDSRQLALAIGFSPEKMAVNANAELLAWRGLDTAAQLAADNAAAAAEYLRAGDIKRPGYRALMVLHLSRGRYREAFQVASRMRADDRLDFDNEALPNLVEAGVRSDHHDAAAAALAELVQRATASGTSWALGLMTRSQALLEPADPEPLYQQSIGHLGKTTVITDLARAHLLYGEWLRRQKRRLDARNQLQHAYDLFTGMGAPAFARRAGAELAATGARVHKHAPGQADALTAQEAQIARLAAGGATNQMIAAELFISSHTVGYHLTKVFRKLGVTSRQQLHTVLDR